MKTLGNRSLSGILAGFIQILWWLEWIGAIVIIAALIIVPPLKKDISFSTPVTFSPITIKTVTATGDSLQTGQLNAVNGNFSLLVQPGLANTAGMVFTVVVAFSFLIMGTYQLKLIFLSFKKDEPFAEFNIARIRKIGLILIGYAVAQLLYSIALNQYLMAHYKWGSDIHLTLNLNFSALFTGATLIIIAEVFKLGASMDNEQKLTI